MAPPKGCVHLLEPPALLAQLMAFEVHPRHGSQCDRMQALVLWLVARTDHCRLAGQFGGAAEPAAKRLREREMAEAVEALAVLFWRGGGGRPRIQGPGRLIEPARP